MGPEFNIYHQTSWGKRALLVAGALLLIGAGWYVYKKVKADGEDTFIVVPTFTFSEEGTLTKDNPGMKKGAWYLVYNESESTSQSIRLEIPSESICAVHGVGKRCSQVELEKGAQVNIQGTLDGDHVTVTYITVL
jgi:hypothetical protein